MGLEMNAEALVMGCVMGSAFFMFRPMCQECEGPRTHRGKHKETKLSARYETMFNLESRNVPEVMLFCQ